MSYIDKAIEAFNAWDDGLGDSLESFEALFKITQEHRKDPALRAALNNRIAPEETRILMDDDMGVYIPMAIGYMRCTSHQIRTRCDQMGYMRTILEIPHLVLSFASAAASQLIAEANFSSFPHITKRGPDWCVLQTHHPDSPVIPLSLASARFYDHCTMSIPEKALVSLRHVDAVTRGWLKEAVRFPAMRWAMGKEPASLHLQQQAALALHLAHYSLEWDPFRYPTLEQNKQGKPGAADPISLLKPLYQVAIPIFSPFSIRPTPEVTADDGGWFWQQGDDSWRPIESPCSFETGPSAAVAAEINDHLWSDIAQVTVGFLRHSDAEPQVPWLMRWQHGRWAEETS